MNLWQISTIALYLLGAVVSLRVIYFSDENAHPKSSGYEKVIYCLFWPALTVGCILVAFHEWLKERK